ncbi:MAG: hypothetical protein ACJ8LG_10380 [Massilia sp.]
MATEDQHDGKAGAPAAPQAPASLSNHGAARRRFAKAGIGATGVLMTLTSQPGMATDICTTPSGSLSGGLKSHHGPAPVCSGVSPGYWKNNTSWPSGCKPTTRFGHIFTCNPKNSSTYGATDCLTMLSHQDFDQSNLGMHLVASYLNILSGRISFLSVQALQKIWTDWQSTGYYSPAKGVSWNSADIVLYLTGTMG